MANYVRQSNKLNLRGMNVTQPANRLSMEWAEFIRNLRSYVVGEWRQRPGLINPIDIDPFPAVDAVLWGDRINDLQAGTFRRMRGTAAGKVFVDNGAHTAYALADSGYSSDPYTSVVARPELAPLPSLFLANDARQSKFSTIGVRTEWGLAQPLDPLTAELVRIAYKTIDLCDSSLAFTVTNGVKSTQVRIAAGAISNLLYDTGTTGWVNVNPTTMDENIQEGMFITFSGGPETVIVESVYQPISSTTIDSIVYDTGATGLCTIQLATPTQGLQRNSYILLGGSESVRVLSVTLGLDGIPSFRCSTVGTFVATDTVDGLRSFRAWADQTHTTAETLTMSYVQDAVTGAGLSTLGLVTSLDLSLTDTGADRPIQEDDFIHVSLKIEDFTLVSEIQLQFDFDASTNDFTKNYFFKSVRPPDLLAAFEQTASSLTAQQQEIQRQQIDDYRTQQLLAEKAQIEQELASGGGIVPLPVDFLQARLNEINAELGGGLLVDSGQGALSTPGAGGANQWTELKIPIKEFQRVGSDTTRGWANIAAFQISITASGAVDVGLNSLWIGGTYGPDVSGGMTVSPNETGMIPGYSYVWRARNTDTGSRSNPSPPLRSPVLPEREAVTLTLPSTYPDTQADVFDIFRAGGTIPEYHYVGTIPSGGSLVFEDDLPDDWITRQALLEEDRFKPWPTSDNPKEGTVDVTGTFVTYASGDLFNTEWLRNSLIIIDDKAYSFYSSPISTTTLELNESAGTLVGARFEIQEATLGGQPLPFVFGPYNYASADVYFALGDPLNPGYLYFTNPADPESAADSNVLELCGPGEKLVAGVVLDGVVYVWSNLRSWRILPSFSGGASQQGGAFYAQETSMGKGLASRWALCAGDQMYFLGFDGIYETKGDAINSITDESIAPLFRRDASGIGQSFANSGLFPVSFDSANEKFTSLTYSYDGLYFTYIGTDTLPYSLYYSFLTKGWMLDTFAVQGATRFFREEMTPGTDLILLGTGRGASYEMSATASKDDGQIISCLMRTREEDWGDTRAQKQIGDVIFDINPGGQQIFLTLAYDQNASFTNLTNISAGLTTRDIFIRDVGTTGAGTLHRSCQAVISWLGGFTGNGLPKLYEWQPAALIKPEATQKRATDWDNGGFPGAKWLQGCRITGDTYNVVKDLTIEIDDGNVGALIQMQADGEQIKAFSWPPVVTHQMRILGGDQDDWRFMGVEWVFEPEPELVTWWETQYTNMDYPGFLHIREMLIAYRSISDIDLTVIIDGVSTGPYVLSNSGGQRVKNYFSLEAHKGKYYTFRFTSDFGFSLYLKDLEVRAGAWGRNDMYIIQHPFGDLSRTQGGARI